MIRRETVRFVRPTVGADPRSLLRVGSHDVSMMARRTPLSPIRWREVVTCLLLMGGCNGACVAHSVRANVAVETFACMMMGPFAGWAIIEDGHVLTALPLLAFATVTTAWPLATYFGSDDEPAALAIAAVAWMFWGFSFTIAASI